MTTGFTTRSKALQEIVLSYFRSCTGEAIVSTKPNIPGAIDIILKGSLASRFETVSVPLSGQSGSRLLRLLFDRDFAAIAPGYELIVPRSHVLRLIQNELSGRAAFSRAGAMFNLDFTFADLEAFGINVNFAKPEVACHFVSRRYYAIRYLLRQASYERNEDTLLVVVGPAHDTVLPSTEAAKFAELNLVDFRSLPYKEALNDFGHRDKGTLAEIFQLSMDTAKQRVSSVLNLRASELNAQMESECFRVNRQFAAESKEATPARRLELDRLRDQELKELSIRYRPYSELSLVSVQELVVPKVDYTLQIVEGSKLNSLPQIFTFDPLDNAITSKHCDQCGQAKNWDYCSRGVHLDCSFCSTLEKCCHNKCQSSSCNAHAIRCKVCTSAVCAEHEHKCYYCKTDARYCETHVLTSYENLTICPACAHDCSDCGKTFPIELATICVVCGEQFCTTHSSVCPGCGDRHCVKHGSPPRNRHEVFCHNCLVSCVECDGSGLFVKDDLQYCTNCGSALCSDHVSRCVSCDAALCSSHILESNHGSGCSFCFSMCGTCGTIHHRSELSHCLICPQSDEGLHCKPHLLACALCSHPVCHNHFIEMHDGNFSCLSCVSRCKNCSNYFAKSETIKCSSCNEVFCASDSARCELCLAPFCDVHLHGLDGGRRACSDCSSECASCHCRFARSELTACHDCGESFCVVDSVKSEFRDESYCKQHSLNFVSCCGCDRNGPDSQRVSCHLCGVSYCPCCIANSDRGCDYCLSSKPIGHSSELNEWHSAFSNATLIGVGDSQRIEILSALAGNDSAFLFSVSESRTHFILRADWRKGFFNYLRSFSRNVGCFVMVRERNSANAEVRLIK